MDEKAVDRQDMVPATNVLRAPMCEGRMHGVHEFFNP